MRERAEVRPTTGADRRMPRRSARAMASVGMVVLLLAGAAEAGAAANPTTAERLHAARSRLLQLERTIGDRTRALDALHGHMLDVLARADAARTKQEAIQAQLVDLDVRLRDTREAYDAARSRLNQRAADAYMFGPQEGIAMVLGASSAGDLADRVSFVDALQASDASLGRQTAASAERLDGLRGTKDTLLQAQEAQVATLASEQQDVATTFAAQQSALQALAGPRGELVALVSSLRTRMTQEEQAAANGAERGSSVTAFDAWSKLLLGHLGDPVCMNDRIVVVAWETAEFTKAAWNPLATTHDMPGATEFNSAGVKNYVSLEQGLEATIETLRGGAPSYRYGPILDGLASCGDPMSTALAVNASAWCNGCAGGRYVVDVVPAIEAYFAQHPS